MSPSLIFTRREAWGWAGLFWASGFAVGVLVCNLLALGCAS